MTIDAGVAWRAVSVLVLLWLAFFFGRTLWRGREPLITRIARVSDPALAPELLRYTRALTALWCAYFVAAALLASAWAGSAGSGLWVWLGTAVLFVGEHRLRPHFFPGHAFPGLRQQFLDTLHVWRPTKRSSEPK